MSRIRKIHYGWAICAGCAALLACSAGMINNAFGIFLVSICTDLGCSRTSISLCQTMFAVSGLLVSLASGYLYSKFRLIAILRISAIGAGCCCAVFALSRSIPVMVGLAFFMGLFSALESWVPVSILISNWFHRRRSFALGVALTGSGVGGMLFSAAGGLLLGTLGWRSTFLLFSGIATAITVPVTFFVIRATPYDAGLRPYGELETEETSPALTGPGLKSVLSMPRFYGLLVCVAVMGVGANAINGTLSGFLQDEGFPAAFSSFMYSVYMGTLIFGKVALGWAYDHLGLRKATVLGLTGMATTAALLFLTHSAYLAVAASVMMGFGLAIGSLLSPVLAREQFGTRDYGGISGLFMAACSMGGVFALTFMGVARDGFGSYRPAYAAIALLVALVGIAIVPLTVGNRMRRSGI